MRVWIVNHYAMPPSEGVGTRHYDLSRVLIRRGHSVVIFSSSFGHFGGREMRLAGARLAGREIAGGVVFRWVRTPPYRGNGAARIANMLAFAVLFPAVQMLHRRPDVVIGSTVHPFAAFAALVVARARGAGFIFEVRDLWPESLVDMGAMRRHSLRARALARLQTLLCRHADHVICLMPGAVEYLGRMAGPDVPVTYLPNGVDLAAGETPIPPEAGKALRTARRRASFVAAYVGSFGPANGIDTLLEAAALLERDHPGLAHLLLVGDGPCKKQMATAALERGTSNVTFVAPIPKTSVRPFLRAIDAAVFHLLPLSVLRYGVSANKLFDYFAAARPIVFACTALNDPAAEAGAGVSVPPMDPEALAGAILQLAESPREARDEMGRSGLEFVRQQHDTELLGARLASIIESVAARDIV
jgi:glycosyltransferase involved in cell wall biosynthesis